MSTTTSRALLLLVIFGVNLLALVYQIVWVRKAGFIFGTDALSISTILSVFMAGIALGGWLGGRLLERVENKAVFAGALLFGLAVYCGLSLYLLDLARYPFLLLSSATGVQWAISLIKFLFCVVVLLVPTTIIGMLFPWVTHLYTRELKSLGADVASVYSFDTLGAALGAVFTGVVLVPSVGLKTISFIAAVTFALLGVLLVAVGRKKSAGRAPDEARARSAPSVPAIKAGPALSAREYFILASLFASGFAALVLEVVWSRYFHLIIGSSIYAFSIVVAAFLSGLSAGSFIARRYSDRLTDPVAAFAWIELFICGAALLVVQVNKPFESLYLALFFNAPNFYLFQTGVYVAAFVLMFVPAALMGANFPIAIKIFARSEATRGKDAGLVFSINTAGGIAGAFGAGFLIIPLLGIEKTVFLASLIYLAIGASFLVAGVGIRGFITPSRSRPIVFGSIAALFVLFSILAWGEPNLNVSAYYHGVRFGSTERFFDYRDKAEFIYSKHGVYGLVSVEGSKDGTRRVLYNNGKADASASRGDMETQVRVGLFPFFFHRNPQTALNIGLGSGVTLGAMAGHPGLVRLDCVEINPLVAEAAEYFSHVNNNAMKDPRVRVYLEDGRHFLQTTPTGYDVIVSEPSNIWISGVSQLYTEEFYEIVDEHMNPGAVFAQWLPGYEVNDEELDLILRTLRGRFEHVIFTMNRSDIIMLASHAPFVVDYPLLAALLANPSFASELSKTIAEPDQYKLQAEVERAVNTATRVSARVEADDTINGDDMNRLEFNTARNMFHNRREKRMAQEQESRGL